MSELNYRNIELRCVSPKSDQATLTINYPRVPKSIVVNGSVVGEIEPVSKIEIDLCDVRAADGIRIHYDFGRDGWVIEQAQYFSWDCDDKVCDPGWKELCFIQAWGSKISKEDD